MSMDPNKVALFHSKKFNYPSNAPYNPHINYPEYSFGKISEEKNFVYNAFRESLILLGLDKKNFGSVNWNPLSEFINPGDTVVINPNFVIDQHEKGGCIYSIITHPSILRAISDYVLKATKEDGRIIIADSPQMDCDFNNLLNITKLNSLKEFYGEQKFNLEIYDLRNFWINVENGLYLSRNRQSLEGDPEGSTIINLKEKSLFFKEKNHDKYYGADYNRNETIRHHSGETQEYSISNTILNADVVICAPKLKTHKKVGVTLNMKGLVGINTNKNYLVHYKVGSPTEGGDEFPPNLYSSKDSFLIKMQRISSDFLLSQKNQFTDHLYKKLTDIAKHTSLMKINMNNEDKVCCGNWSGNNSAWRMTVDLLKIFLYADKNGKIKDSPQRKMFSVVDGFIGGDGDGPLAPDAKYCGIMTIGTNICAVDLVCTRIMGFDISKIKMLNYIIKNQDLYNTKIETIEVLSNLNLSNLFNDNNFKPYFNFNPPKNWTNIRKIHSS